MTLFRYVLGEKIVISDDVQELRSFYEKGLPVVLVLNDSNQNEDTSFIKYAVTEDFLLLPYNDGTGASEVDADATEYLEKIVKRHKKIPLEITRTDRLVIRELTAEDADNLIKIYGDAGGRIEAFYGNRDEAHVYLEEYVCAQYDLFGYGIWGVVPLDSLNEKGTLELAGIVGISDKGEGCELLYAFRKGYRGRGYAYEAAKAALIYARSILETEDVLIRVQADNTDSLKLAKKLEKEGGVRII